MYVVEHLNPVVTGAEIQFSVFLSISVSSGSSLAVASDSEAGFFLQRSLHFFHILLAPPFSAPNMVNIVNWISDLVDSEKTALDYRVVQKLTPYRIIVINCIKTCRQSQILSQVGV